MYIYIIYTTAVHIHSLPGGFNPQNSSSFGGIIQGYPKMEGTPKWRVYTRKSC